MTRKSTLPTSVLLERRILGVAEQMIRRGARIPVVAAVLPIKKEKVGVLYREITGEEPKTGPLPSDHNWYTRTTYPMRIVQSSILIRFFRETRERSPAALEGEVLVAAYDLYLDHCDVAIGAEPLLSFCRAWHLTQQLRIKNLTTTGCVHCGGQFVSQAGKLRSKYMCPLCVRSPSLRPNTYKRIQRTEVRLAA